ncbi:MAG: hypothetical protein OEY23_27045, partial [Acidimicrobiia bacterium]|nr:hypothetical protein [Acidimicrobiia bacterium]
MGQPIRVPPSRLARLAVALAAVLIGVGASVVAPVAGSANPVGSPGTDVGSGFHAIAPVRLADTRSGEPTVDGAGPRGSIGAGEVIDIVVAGRAGLPASGVDAVAVNLTAVGATDLTYLTAWPAGEVRPTASNLNPLGAEAVTSMALVKVGAAGRISIYNHRGSVHLVVDLSGWFATGGGYVSLNPGRVLDTRVGEPTVVDDGRQTPLGAGETMQLRLAGRAGLPTEGVAAVALAVVALDATAPGFVTIWPAGAARPTASNLNPWGRDPVANLVTVATSADGAVSLFNYDGDVEVVVDVAGWFPVGGGFEPLVPARLVDTRPGEPTIDGAGPRGELGSNGSLTARVAQRAGMPDAVAAVLLNLTVVDASEATYLTVHPGEGPRPTASNLNPAQPRAVTNAVVAQVSAAGTIEVYNLRGAVHVVIDVAGWFPPSQPQPPDEHALLDEAEGVTLPPLADGRPITYGFQGVQGESLSFVIDPLPGPDDKPPCGGTLTVRRPDGSVYAEATGRACAGPFAAIGVDVAVDRTGRWAVSFERRGPPRPTSAGRLTLRRSRTLGRLEVGSPIELRDLPAGAKLRWALPDSDE